MELIVNGAPESVASASLADFVQLKGLPAASLVVELNRRIVPQGEYVAAALRQYLLRHPEVNATLLDWSQSDNIWLRRVAIDHQLLRKGQTDTALLEAIIRYNLELKEFFINKAIGWALRDYSKTDPDWVSQFIARYRNQMNALSIREGSKYIPV